MKFATCITRPGRVAITTDNAYREGQRFEIPLPEAVRLKQRGDVDIVATRDNVDRIEREPPIAGTRTMLAPDSRDLPARFGRGRR